MRDRQVFEEITLLNGIRIFYYPDTKVHYADIRFIFPLGHAHNTGSIIPGSAHCLEHMLMLRSTIHPNFYQFGKEVGLQGGYFNASTSHFATTYFLEAASDMVVPLFEGLLSKIFDPIFTEEDLAIQRIVISNERKKERWFPSTTEPGYYASTEWIYRVPVSLEQIFGTDKNLNSITCESLMELHRYYFSKETMVMVGGNCDISTVQRLLEKIPTRQFSLPTQFEPLAWKKREYHEKAFSEINRYNLYVGSFANISLTVKESIGINFIGNLLMNDVHGALYDWIRNEKGWSYGTSYAFQENKSYFYWYLYFPLEKMEQIEIVRLELRARIESALTNKKLIATEVNRKIKSAKVRSFETLQSIMKAAREDIALYEHVISEKTCREQFCEFQKTDYLLSLYEKYFSPENTGELCFIPKK